MKGVTRREAGGVLHQRTGSTHLGHAEGQDVVENGVQGREGGVYGIEPVDGDVPAQDFFGGGVVRDGAERDAPNRLPVTVEPAVRVRMPIAEAFRLIGRA